MTSVQRHRPPARTQPATTGKPAEAKGAAGSAGISGGLSASVAATPAATTQAVTPAKKAASESTVASARKAFLQQGVSAQTALNARVNTPEQKNAATPNAASLEPCRVPEQQPLTAPDAPTETSTERARRLGGDVLNPENLKPGESAKVTLGGSASGGAGLAAKADRTSSMEVKANKDGTYTVTVDGKAADSLMLTAGGKTGKVGLNGSGEVSDVDSRKVELTAKTPEEARQLVNIMMRKTAADAAKDKLPLGIGNVMPDPVTADEQKLLNRSITAVEETSGKGLGFSGTAGVADDNQPLVVGGTGTSSGTDTLTKRTEFKLDDKGEPYTSKVIEKRVHAGELTGNAGLTVKSGDVEIAPNLKSGGKKTSSRELEITTEFPPPGTGGEPKTTAVMREEQMVMSENGRNTQSQTIKKEQEVDLSRTDKHTLLKTLNEWDPAKLARLPAKESKVTITTQESASNERMGPYNQASRKTEVTYNVDPNRQAELFADHDAHGDATRVKNLADRNAEATVTRTDTRTEGAGTGGRLGVNVMGTGVEVEADIQKNAELVTKDTRTTEDALQQV